VGDPFGPGCSGASSLRDPLRGPSHPYRIFSLAFCTELRYGLRTDEQPTVRIAGGIVAKKRNSEERKAMLKKRREGQLARWRPSDDPALYPQGKYIPAGKFKNTKPENR
jgi:hypothetical protein